MGKPEPGLSGDRHMGKMSGKVKDQQLFTLIRNFLLVYLPVQRNASKNTVTTYRTVLNQFIHYLAKQKGISQTAVTFDMFSYHSLSSYLDSLSTDKSFSPATRNNRLAAIRAFVSYASACYPEYIALTSELSNVKVQKDDPFGKVSYLSEEAIRVLLLAPDTSTRLGLRDQFLMILIFDTGARIQELLHIRLCDLKTDNSPQVILHGKGGKVRTVPLMKDTVEHLQRYLAVFHADKSLASTELLFYMMHIGIPQPLSDDAVRKRMKKYAESARLKCRDIPENVHPHLFRHSRAMHLYQHGMPLELVSQWLGHANPETTLVYAYADTEHKREAIERALGNNAAPGIGTDSSVVTDEEMLKRLYGL